MYLPNLSAATVEALLTAAKGECIYDERTNLTALHDSLNPTERAELHGLITVLAEWANSQQPTKE